MNAQVRASIEINRTLADMSRRVDPDGVAGALAGANLTDAAVSIDVTQGRWRRLPAATLSMARILTLGTTGAQNGDEITITRDDVSANTYTIANGGGGGGNLLVMPASKQGFITAQFNGTDWIAKAVSPN